MPDQYFESTIARDGIEISVRATVKLSALSTPILPVTSDAEQFDAVCDAVFAQAAQPFAAAAGQCHAQVSLALHSAMVDALKTLMKTPVES